MKKTYGSLTRSKSRGWIIQAEAHVVIKAKRLFTGARQGKVGELAVSDTVTNCRDLEWFCDRHPLSMSAKDEAYLRKRSSDHREREDLVAQLVSGACPARSFALALPPRDYQRVAAELVLRNGGLLLCDDMGLGKTVSSICALTDPRTRPALVVTKSSLCKQWQREIQKFAPSLASHIIKKGTPYDITLSKGARSGQLAMPGAFPDVLITTYSKLEGWVSTLAPLLKMVIYDEIQSLRAGTGTRKGAAAAALSEAAMFRLGLSGTPIYNMGSEIHPVVGFVVPDALGERHEFLREWCGERDARGNAKLRDPKAMGTYLRETGVMLRRTCADVGRELPEEIRVPHHIEVDERPLRDITSAAMELAKIIVERNGSSFRQMKAHSDFDMMVRHATGVAKAAYVAEFVRMLLEQGRPVVLYGWHRDVYNIWLERLGQYKPAMFTGTETASRKDQELARFCSRETDLLIMSLRSGEGVDGLQYREGAVVVFGELDWSPGVHEQCITRVKRDGREEPVVVYYLIADEGSDPPIADLLQVKRSQVEGIRNPDADIIEKLDVSGERIRDLAAQYLKQGPRQAPRATPVGVQGSFDNPVYRP